MPSSDLIVELRCGEQTIHNNCTFRISSKGVLRIYKDNFNTDAIAAYNNHEWRKVNCV